MPLGFFEPGRRMTARPAPPSWFPIAFGLSILYLPSFIDFSRTIWRSEEQWHSPLILLVSAWYFWRLREHWLTGPGSAPTAAGSGWGLLCFGLLLYVAGRSQEIIVFEVGSLIPVLAGTLAIQSGWPAVRALWFPLLFLAFATPMQGALIYTLTGPLKQSVSELAEILLHLAGYPIGRSGVVLTIGQYQLLVADACSGLNSMFSLSALGLFYIYRKGHRHWPRNAILLASVLPTAFLANVVRVALLALVTYHFGDAAGQNFLHNFAGMLLFFIALAILFLIDSLLNLVPQWRAERVKP